jgi:hypothetical protein
MLNRSREVTDGGDGIRMWRVAVNLLNKRRQSIRQEVVQIRGLAEANKCYELLSSS